ncbi:uncharacterized protein BDW70DRAFT_146130 [Aspergillus foveolatus]|uniref:uncharacterized protein n=1 Tax=Aspergillus foveolatus TaxID=210207 RepID=UPI003CCDE01D
MTDASADTGGIPMADSSADVETDAESDNSSRYEAPLALLLYRDSGLGWCDIRPTAVKGQKPWSELEQVQCASLETWEVRLYDIVTVCVQGLSEGYAKVTDLRDLEDGRFMVVYTWLYTRAEILEEYTGPNGVPPRLQENLDRNWPADSEFNYMLSSNRTVTLWDTALRRAPEHVASKICDGFVYVTTTKKKIRPARWIYSVKEPKVKWLADILSKKGDHTKKRKHGAKSYDVRRRKPPL